MKYEILDEQGEVINVILADAEFVEAQYPGRYREVSSDPVVAMEESWNVSKRAFKARFPRAKWIAAKVAAANDAALADFFEDFELASYIGLKDPVTIAAVTALSDPATPASFQLTAEEVDVVLGTPAGVYELP